MTHPKTVAQRLICAGRILGPAWLILVVSYSPSRAQLTVTDVSPDAAFAAPLADGDAPSGRVNGIVIDPTNSSILYAASEWAGIWKSVDAGHTWSQSSQGLRSGITQELLGIANPGRQVLALDALNPKRLLYATHSPKSFSNRLSWGVS